MLSSAAIRHILGTALLAFVAALPRGADAHPHVWLTVRSSFELDAEGRLVAVATAWTFDEFYSAFVQQGLDKDGDGKVSPEEFAPVTDVNIRELGPYGYFTELRVDGKAVAFGKAEDAEQRVVEGELVELSFKLPLAEPLVAAGRRIVLQSFDPTYYIAMDLPEAAAGVGLSGAGAGRCQVTIQSAEGLEETDSIYLADRLAQEDLSLAENTARRFASSAFLDCQG